MPNPARRSARPRALSVLALALFLGPLLSAFVSVVAPGDVLGASATRAAACAGVNLRTSPTTRSTARVVLRVQTTITVSATVNGSAWTVSCAGKSIAGSKWYRISAINGKSVKSRYGMTYLYAATGLFKAPGTATATAPKPSSTRFAACSGVKLRTSARTTATARATLNVATSITLSATNIGGSWTAGCAGVTVSGTKWYRISAINGKSVKSRYGVTYLYAATGLFQATKPSTTVPQPPPPVAGVTEGIDVSHWQGPVDWVQVRAAGKRFAFIKASESIDFVDGNYATNRAQAKASGLYVGSYHFGQPDLTPGDAIAEADHFLATAVVASGDLLPVLDLEVTGGLAPLDLQAWVRDYLGRIYERTGVRGVIYMSPAFWANNLTDTTWFATNGYKVLWIAHWTTDGEPWVPAGDWAGQGWTFWQYTSSGAVPGISGRVDLDRYNGTDITRVLIP